MANLFFTSDEHFGHFNIIRYCNRPFKTLAQMNETIIKNHNERVKKDDTCIIVGDFCFKNSLNGKIGEGIPVHSKNYIERLNGNLVFIRGNHDCFSKNTRLLTIDGYKYYNEVKKGDLIPTVNLKTNKIEYNPIRKVITCFVDKSYEFNNKTAEGSFSDIHSHWRIPFNVHQTPNTPLDWKETKSKDLWNFKSYLLLPTTFFSGNSNYAITDDYLKLFAWIHTDGYFIKKGTYISFEIYQSKVDNVNEIRTLLSKLNLKVTENKRTRKITHICGKKLKSILPQYEFKILADSAKEINKVLQITDNDKFPNWLNKLSDNQAKFLIKQLIKGDGSLSSSGSISLWGKKEVLTKWLGFCVTHNIDSNVVQDKRGHYYLCIHIRKSKEIGRRLINKKYLKIVPYNDLMWDVEVKNHIIFIEKNGKPLITGNSSNSLNTKIERLILKVGGIYINVCHNPENAIIEDDKYYSLNLVGHVHNAWLTKEITRNCKYSLLLNVGVDIHKFHPISFDEIKAVYDRWLSINPKRKEIQRCLLTQSRKSK